MIRSELRTEIGRKLGDTGNQRWSATVLNDRINHIQRDLVLRTKCLVDVASDSIVAGTNEYALPTDLLDMVRVTIGGKDLEYTDKKTLDLLTSADWSTQTGTPTRYYIDTDPDNLKIGLYPNPQAGDVGTNNLKMYYVKNPTDLSADSGTPGTPFGGSTLLTPHHYAIVYGVAFLCLEDNPADPSNQSKTNEMRSLYEEQIRKIYDIYNNPTDKKVTMLGGRYWRTNTSRVPWTA